MVFNEKLFQEGENAYLNGKRQRQEQGLANFDRLRSIGDTAGMKEASLKAQGRGGLLDKLFAVGNDPYGSPDEGGAPQGPAQKGIAGMNVGGMVKNNMNATDIYDTLQKTFEGDIQGTRNNEERARLFRAYQEKVRHADNIFGWKNSDGLNVRDYLISSGGGGGGKLQRYRIEDPDAVNEKLGYIEMPEGLSNAQQSAYIQKMDKGLYDKLQARGGLDSRMLTPQASETQMNIEKRREALLADQIMTQKAKDNAQSWTNRIPFLGGPSAAEKVYLARAGMDENGNKIERTSSARDESRTAKREVKKPDVNIKYIEAGAKKIKKVW